MRPEELAILVGEDDDNEVLLLKRAIKRIGPYQVFFVPDGHQLQTYLQGEPPFTDREKFPFPNFVLIDLKMPRHDGFEVLEWLKHHPDCKTVPTIIFSGSSIHEDIKRAYASGANSFFTKPSTLEELEATLRLIFHYWSKVQLAEPPASKKCV
jgi:CheY-like chemotaxis protein